MTETEARQKAGAIVALWEMMTPISVIARSHRVPESMVRRVIAEHQAKRKDTAGRSGK